MLRVNMQTKKIIRKKKTQREKNETAMTNRGMEDKERERKAQQRRENHLQPIVWQLNSWSDMTIGTRKLTHTLVYIYHHLMPTTCHRFTKAFANPYN